MQTLNPVANVEMVAGFVSHWVDSEPARKASSAVSDSILYGLSMEGTQSRTDSRELTIRVWDSLGRPAIGESELRQIQASVRGQFGPGAEESPAAIARVLADAGAELRH